MDYLTWPIQTDPSKKFPSQTNPKEWIVWAHDAKIVGPLCLLGWAQAHNLTVKSKLRDLQLSDFFLKDNCQCINNGRKNVKVFRVTWTVQWSCPGVTKLIYHTKSFVAIVIDRGSMDDPGCACSFILVADPWLVRICGSRRWCNACARCRLAVIASLQPPGGSAL